MNKLLFVLPGPSKKIIGGYKIVYIYADYLSGLGYDVNIVYLTNSFVTNRWFIGFKGVLKKNYYHFYKFYSWYPFKNKVKHLVRNELTQNDINDYSMIFLSSVKVAEYFYKYKHRNINYLIQGFEDWSVNLDRLYETYNCYNNISISDFLTNKIESLGFDISLQINNGIEAGDFLLNKPYSNRDNIILFMYHESPLKGVDSLLKVFKESNIKNKYKIICFSAYKKPKDLPNYIEFNYKPSKMDLCNLYNKAKFFIVSSQTEGFCLTAAEAMACGTIVITTDNGGVNDFIIDGKTGFYLKNNDFSKLESLISTIEKKSNLSEISRLSCNKIHSEYSWETSFQKLSKYVHIGCK
ncbi:glycosyltransferase [Photobacterium damselae]|uniref:glycosyltransferase family 4 protein n=1 Tax=Photobacterium damselae TaxID=38293 RepID=UPI001EDCF208|nr:glycosyltransferase [Photobacterium damselae]MCG3817835.1 glycosyltransferase [Photobacterium damselae]